MATKQLVLLVNFLVYLPFVPLRVHRHGSPTRFKNNGLLNPYYGHTAYGKTMYHHLLIFIIKTVDSATKGGNTEKFPYETCCCYFLKGK